MFRFTIRDMLWLTVVVALVFGWQAAQRKAVRDAAVWEHRANAAIGMLKSRGWEVNWHADTSEFEFGNERYTCGPPRSSGNYVWYRVPSSPPK